MKMQKLQTGRRGEAVAKKYLEDKGYLIIDQNYQTRYVEIDLVAYDQKELVFVEVRTKRAERFGTPEESLQRNKINRLIRGAQAYTASRRYCGPYRIDAICIILTKDNQPQRLNHYKNISF